MVQWFSGNGFHPVALLPADIPAQLKLGTGLIDAAPSTPYLALTLSFFRDAKYMLDLHVAPLVGALVMSGDAWNKLTPDERTVDARRRARRSTGACASKRPSRMPTP